MMTSFHSHTRGGSGRIAWVEHHLS